MKFCIKKEENLIKNINYNPSGKQKRVLIAYLDYCSSLQKIDMDNTHTNIFEYLTIIKKFIDLDYVIDTVYANNVNVQFTNTYDVIFGFGTTFRKAVKENPKAKTIIYMTENPAEVALPMEQERLDYFYRRTGQKKKPTRGGLYYKVGDISLADYIIAVGDDMPVYQGKSFRIFPTGLKNNNFRFDVGSLKNRKAFLWMGSLGAVHKGIDILIEVFKNHPDWELHICGLDRKEQFFSRLYWKQSNIISHGFINVQSEEFLKIVNQTTYIILPSCSEGMSTGVLTGMRHGLIPIVTRNTGFNNIDIAYKLEDYHIEYVDKYLEKLVNYNNDNRLLGIKAKNVYDYSNEMFSIKNYSKTLTGIFQKII